MCGRRHIGTARPANRDSHCVFDNAALKFVVAHNGREDRKSGRVRGRPAIGTKFVCLQIEHRRLSRLPAGLRSLYDEELVEHSVHRIDDDGVSITASIGDIPLHVEQCGFAAGAAVVDRPAFDWRACWHGKRARVRLAGIAHDFHVHSRLIRRDKNERHVRVVTQRFVSTDGCDDSL